jgi:acyl-CoA dehydrogenase
MNFELAEEHRMLKDLVRKFVDSELIPLEGSLCPRGIGSGVQVDQRGAGEG